LSHTFSKYVAIAEKLWEVTGSQVKVKKRQPLQSRATNWLGFQGRIQWIGQTIVIW